MQYMFLIYEAERAWVDASAAERSAIYAQYEKYAAELVEAGVLRGGSELKPTSTATTVRTAGGRVVTTDGPFAETKEQLGGYFLVDVPSLDEALDWARRCPGAARGSVEVRPLTESMAE